MTIDEVDDQYPFTRQCGCVCVKERGNSFTVVIRHQDCRNGCSEGLVIDAHDNELFSQDVFSRALEDTFVHRVRSTKSGRRVDTGSEVMGRAARARSHKADGKICYLCGQVMHADTERLNSDHVPPKRIFAKEVRRQHNPSQMPELPTHEACNTGAERDEAYFVVSFAGHCESDVAQAVMRDIKASVAQGEGVGLLRDVVGRFGRVVGSKGERLFEYDPNRVNAFLWKIARGLFAIETGGRVLPWLPPAGIKLMHPRQDSTEIESHNWFPLARDTQPLARYGRVFDYKWICLKDGPHKIHAMAMLFWDRLIATVMFHDPTCECGECEDWKQNRLPVSEEDDPIEGFTRE
jgi:hypothetical protein